jgi:hypothetical protein
LPPSRRMNESGSEFPPKAQRPDQVALLAEAFASVAIGRTAWYVSSPLTSGKRSFEWQRANKELGDSSQLLSEDFKQQVLSRNRTDAARFVDSLRARERSVVIDPTGLADIPGWTQSDYRVLWAEVIRRYVSTVVFRDGWQHSNGCAWEFLTASLADCVLLREDLSRLSAAEARSELEEAAAELRQTGGSIFLVAVLNALDEAGMDKKWHVRH